MIVKSILDTDLYKFTTSYAYMKLFPHAIGTFEFFDRDNTEYTEEFVQQLWIEISNFCSLKLTHDEQDYMTTHCRFIPPMYWEWLSGIRLSAGKVQIWLDEDKHLHIKATDYLYRVTLYEVPILAIVSELRNRMLNHTINMTDVLIRLEPKIVLSNQNQMFFSEFGTRRRYSYNVQEAIVKSLKDSATYCTGTSNCYLAMKYDMPMMGTHPHEWFMFHGAMYGYKQANYMALEDWVEVYDGDLGIALSDTYTSAETYKEIPRWQHGEEILKDNKFLVVDVAHFNSEDIPHDEVKVIYAPDITICSTAIRKWVDDGRIILPFVTDEVNSIIRKLGLYK